MGSLPHIDGPAQAVPLRAVGALPRLGLILLATDLTTERDVARLIRPD